MKGRETVEYVVYKMQDKASVYAHYREVKVPANHAIKKILNVDGVFYMVMEKPVVD